MGGAKSPLMHVALCVCVQENDSGENDTNHEAFVNQL